MIAMFSFVQSWLSQFHDDERGDFNVGGYGILGLILVVLLILCAIVFLWANVDVNEK